MTVRQKVFIKNSPLHILVWWKGRDYFPIDEVGTTRPEGEERSESNPEYSGGK